MWKYVALFVVLFYFDLKGDSVLDLLKTIPANHRQDIEYLFHKVFLQQDGAYTIFGDKPLSSAASFLIPKWEATLEGYPSKLSKSWEIWQKYEHNFPIKNYLIVSELLPLKKSSSVVIYIHVINKQKFIETINDNLSLFETGINTKIDPQKFLEAIATGKNSLLKSIHHNEVLFGILLGYGKHNAFLYKKSKSSRSILCSEKIKRVRSAQEFHSMMLVNPVQFVADFAHHETKMLQQKYRDLHEKISTIYSQGDLLEITISQLISLN